MQIDKAQKKVLALENKTLKLENKMLKQEQKIITLESKGYKEPPHPDLSPAQRKILQECAQRLAEEIAHNEPPKK